MPISRAILIHPTRNQLFALLSVGFALTAPLCALDARAGEINDGVSQESMHAIGVDALGTSLVLRPAHPGGALAVRVTGPGGFVLERTVPVEGELSLPLSAAALQDGLYKYEVRAVPAGLRTRRDSDDIAAPGPIDASVTAGSFRVEQGAILQPTDELETEAAAAGSGPAATGFAGVPTAPDVVLTNSDGVIRNSLCVGFDCPDAPAFDDSTIVLMENNTRIKFGDTSTGSFPGNDWEIEANSANNGGANYLGFNDCGNADNDGGCATDLVFAVESGARASALYVESDGDVGFGTSNPVTDLHMVTGDSPTVRLDQNSSSGFTPQVWDMVGNEVNFFIRDVTAGSRLPFRIRPGAPTSSIDISGTGDIGIGTASPSAPLSIVRNGTTINAGFLVQNTGGFVPSTWFFSNQSTNGAFIISTTGAAAPFKVFPGAPLNSLVVGQNGGVAPVVGIHKMSGLTFPLTVGTDATNGNGAHVTAAGVWTNGSSRQNKIDIVDLEPADALAAVMGLRPVRYKGKNSPDREEYVGFIAEEVPELVAQNDRASLSPMDIVAALTKVLQLERTRNDELEARLATVEAQLARSTDRGSAPTPRP